MRKRYNHTASVEQYRIRNRFSHTTNITTTTQTSPNANNQVLLNDSMNFHENYSNDNESSKFDNEDEYEKDEDEDYDDDDYYDNDYEEDEDEEEDDDDYEEDEDEEDDDDDYEEDEDEEEDDDDKGNKKKDDDNNDPIIDAPIDCNQMPYTNENFSPYFENTTSALLFCWMQKHNICKFK